MPKSAIKLLLNLSHDRRRCAGSGRDARHRRRKAGAEIEIAIRAEGPRILLDPAMKTMLVRGASGPVEPRAAAVWLANRVATEAGGSIIIHEPVGPFLLIGATLPIRT